MNNDNFKGSPPDDTMQNPASETDAERKKQLKDLVDAYPAAVRSELYELLELEEKQEDGI